MLERHRREEKRRGVLSRAEVRSVVAVAIDTLGERFSLSHARAKRTAGTLELFQRLCEPPPMDWTVRHVTSHPQWQEAVLLFEMLADATGEGHEMIEAWRMAALEARDSPPTMLRRRPGRENTPPGGPPHAPGWPVPFALRGRRETANPASAESLATAEG